MSMALENRITTLEAQVKALREIIDLLAAPPVNPNGPRQMCPKCHEKPNYHLHVINCKGKK